MARGCSWSRVACVATVVALAAPADAGRRSRQPRPGTELTTAQLGWPVTTRSLRARDVVKVYREPGRRERWGKLAAGTRVAWKRVLVVRHACRTWAEIEPRGWACVAHLAPSDEPPLASAYVDPASIVDRTLARPFVAVAPAGTRAYPTLEAIRRGRAKKKLGGWTFLRIPLGVVELDGERFYRTMHGWVRAAATMPRPASAFGGRDLVASPPPAWPFAWVEGKQPIVRDAPDATATAVRELARREVVAVYEARAGFLRIGANEWIAREHLRVVRQMMRPHGVRADERWLDVDLDEQVLVAYDGDRPVFATLVSTGKSGSTPTAIHRVRKKHAITRLKAPAESYGTWDMPEVPFSLAFRKYYAAHGAYWHDGFGAERSQGCVNLAPRDARWVFEWSSPQVPAGWIEGSAYREEGTPIRLRDHRDPDPKWADHDAPPPPSVKLRDVALAD